MSRRRRPGRRRFAALALAAVIAVGVALQSTYAASNTVSGSIHAGDGAAAIKSVSFTAVTWTYDASGNATSLAATLAFTPSTTGRLAVRVSSALPWTFCTVASGHASFTCALGTPSQGPLASPDFVYVGS